MTITIIGGGAAGIAAALAAAENPNVQVLLLERQVRVGRKLQATGNGRCNLTNLHALEGGYHGESPAFAQCALEAFGPVQTLEWFKGLGLFTVVEQSGRVYPYSDQANSVVDVLRFALNGPNITLLTSVEVTKVKKRHRASVLREMEIFTVVIRLLLPAEVWRERSWVVLWQGISCCAVWVTGPQSCARRWCSSKAIGAALPR